MKAKGLYDSETDKILWAYNPDPTTTAIDLHFTKILFFNLPQTAFYEYTIADSSRTEGSPIIAAPVRKEGLGVADEVFDIVLGSDDVVLGADDVVLTLPTGVSETTSATKFLTLIPPDTGSTTYRITFSEFTNRSFTDWASSVSSQELDLDYVNQSFTLTGVDNEAGADFTSEVVTGWRIEGEAARDKQIKFLVTHFERTEENWVDDGAGGVEFDFPSSAKIRMQFEFTSDSSEGRWTDQFEAYRFPRTVTNPGTTGSVNLFYDVISTKNRIRGVGRGFSVQIQSDSFKDLRMLGYDALVTGRSRF